MGGAALNRLDPSWKAA